jgi:hypothetical protein
VTGIAKTSTLIAGARRRSFFYGYCTVVAVILREIWISAASDDEDNTKSSATKRFLKFDLSNAQRESEGSSLTIIIN